MIEKIEPFPKIPEALRLAAHQSKLIPFVIPATTHRTFLKEIR